jgi:hypothetical protein
MTAGERGSAHNGGPSPIQWQVYDPNRDDYGSGHDDRF